MVPWKKQSTTSEEPPLSKLEKNVPRTKPVRLTNESLPAEQIDIILRVEAGLSTAEASELLRCPNWVKMHLKNGLVVSLKMCQTAYCFIVP
jgi:hypothetical protein